MERRTVYFKEDSSHFKIDRKLVWRLYLRFATRQFVPCEKCQVAIEKEVQIAVNSMSFQNGYQLVEIIINNVLCKQCRENMAKKIMHSDRIILGNKEYEPLIELQREWEDISDSRVEISYKDYNDGLNTLHKHK